MTERAPITCQNCTSACCRAGIHIALTEVDADFLKTGGTILGVDMHPNQINRIIGRGQPRKAGFDLTPRERRQKRLYDLAERLMAEDISGNTGMFTLESDCGHLGTKDDGTTFCKVHADPRRPLVCQRFKAGSHPCQSIRVKAGVDQGSI